MSPLAELSAAFARGIYRESVDRGREMLPREAWTVIERGDVLRLAGAPEDIDRAAAHIGFRERDLDKTDLAFVAGGISLGILIGCPSWMFTGCRSASGSPVPSCWSDWPLVGRAGAIRFSVQFPNRRSVCCRISASSYSLPVSA